MRRPLAIGLLLGTLFVPAVAQADETWLVTAEGNVGIPVGKWQSEEYGPGGALALGGYRSLAPFALVGVRARAGLLFNGDAVGGGRADLGPGTWVSFSGSLRLRPSFDWNRNERGTGLFVEASPGVVLTGGLTRFGIEAGLGYGFETGALDVGPVLRYVHILQGSSGLDDRDAHIVMVGVELGLLDGRPDPPKAPPPKPQSDRDHDGILDEDDKCPDDPEDIDGFEDTDGCPDEDNDRDGILDKDDQCPLEPEDIDGFEDTDGCPDKDNDDDGFLDPDDQCPNDAEIVNGIEDDDGCPDKGLIEMKDDRIVLEETVLFDFERARVRSSARPILEAIVRLWKQHENDWRRVRIEGHADARGDAAFNHELSERRAGQVKKVLTDLGIPAEVMVSEGFGATKLRDKGTTDAAHARNRRVEFVVIPDNTPEEDAATDSPASVPAVKAPAPAPAPAVKPTVPATAGDAPAVVPTPAPAEKDAPAAGGTP